MRLPLFLAVSLAFLLCFTVATEKNAFEEGGLGDLLNAFGGLGDLGGLGDFMDKDNNDPDLKNAKSKYDQTRKKKKVFNFLDVDLEKEKNACLSNPHEYSSKTEAYLNNFIQGTCYPIVLSPGIMGSRLRALIKDCEKLPLDIIESCNLNCTNQNSFETDVWLDLSFDGPSSFVYPKKKCFSSLISADMNGLSDLIEINFYGRTPQTKKDDKSCGSNAARELGGKEKTNTILSLLSLGLMTSTIDNDKRGLHNDGKKERETERGIDRIKGLSIIIDVLKHMGYREGLTLFVLPFDWRYSAGHEKNPYYADMDRTLNIARDLTGKKSLLIALSFGGLNVLNYLNKKTQEEKDQLVERFIPVGVPFTGAFDMLKYMIAGSDDFSFQNQYGFKFEEIRPLFSSFPSIFDLMIKDIFDEATEKDKEWWADINKRILHEEQYRKISDSSIWTDYADAFEWFPKGDKPCVKDRGPKNKYCGFHFFNYQKNPFVATKKENFSLTKENIKQFLTKFMIRTKEEIADPSQVVERVSKQVDEVYKNNIHKLINPGVPVSLIYGAIYETGATLNLTRNPVNKTNKNKVLSDRELRVKTAYGDGTIIAESTLTAGLKWAWEFDKGVGKYPLEVIEYCSDHNNIFLKDQAYSKKNYNVYYGLKCNKKDHGGLLGDEYIAEFISRIAKSGPEGEYRDLEGLAGFESKCPNLNENAQTGIVEKFKLRKKDEL